jgi:hypothetical protein
MAPTFNGLYYSYYLQMTPLELSLSDATIWSITISGVTLWSSIADRTSLSGRSVTEEKSFQRGI